MNLNGKRVILASNSPRRKQLLAALDVDFTVDTRTTFEESFPQDMPHCKVPAAMSYGKSMGFWRELDEDVSFESFAYDDAEPSSLQRFFLTHKEINVAEFARSLGINPTLLRNYINGFKTPSKKREMEILDHIHRLGEEMIAA